MTLGAQSVVGVAEALAVSDRDRMPFRSEPLFPAPNVQQQQRLLEKAHLADRLQHLLEILPSGVVVLDIKGTIEIANSAAQSLLEHSLLGYAWREIIGELFEPKPDDGHEISLKNGKKVNIATQGSDSGSSTTGQVIIITDMTETRLLQQEVAHNKRLTLLGEMAATLAHQIRTPLATAHLYLSELSIHRLHAEKFEINIQKIFKKLNLLNQQVEDMLIFSRKECQLNDTVLLTVLLDEAIDVVQAKAQQKQIDIKTDCLTTSICLKCHYTSLLGAVVNILVNAIEASDLGQTIQVKIEYQPASDQCSLHIIDEGVGFKPSQIDECLKAFNTDKKEGHGLGMKVVRWVMDTHGYQLNIHSHPNQGADIEIVLNGVMSCQ